jgi:hypothetical protein
VLNPTDAAALDLSADAGGFVFPVTPAGDREGGLRDSSYPLSAGTGGQQLRWFLRSPAFCLLAYDPG